MKQYNATLRIPTEMYAFIEIKHEGTPEDIVEAYREFTKLVKPVVGLPTKEFNQALDRYLTDGDMEAEVYVSMSDAQKAVIQEIKKSVKRIKAKNE